MTASLRNASLRQLAFLAGGLVALICVALLTLSSLREWGLRHETLKAAEVDLANVAQSVVQHADDSFELADSLLIGLVHRLEADGIGPGAVQRLRDDIDLRKGTMGRVRALFVYDAAGRWLATAEPVNPALFNNSDREYFKQHRASPDKGLLIGSPIKSRSGGQWVITASRRFDHPDGSFAGGVLATIDASYFANFYRRFDLGSTGTITLLDKSGVILARSVDNDSAVGRDVSATPLFQDMDARRRVQGVRKVEGLKRLC